MPSGTIYFASTDLQPASLKWRFWLPQPPTIHPLPEVRGEDTVVPAASGRFVQLRKADRLVIPMLGFVAGVPNTYYDEAAEEQDYLNSWDTLGTIFDTTAAPAALVVYGPSHGVASGKKRTINARVLNVVFGNGIPGTIQNISVELESVDSPPVWVEANN